MRDLAARYRLGDLPDIGPAVVAIGVFDGVHRGHQALVDGIRSTARRLDARGVVVVIHPHPDEVFGSSAPVERLSSLAGTAELLCSYGVDEVVVVEFDRDVASLEPDDFIVGLEPGIEVRAVVMTEESAFGRARSGTPDRVRAIGQRRGFELAVVPLLQLEGGRVSSTRVRDAVSRGDLATARRLLGRPHAVEGVAEPIGLAGGVPERVAVVPSYAAALPPAGECRAQLVAVASDRVDPETARVLIEMDRILVESAAPRAGELVRVSFL